MPINYTDQFIWPVIELSNFFDVPLKLKNRTIDPVAAFEDAGIEMIYHEKDSIKVSITCYSKLFHAFKSRTFSEF